MKNPCGVRAVRHVRHSARTAHAYEGGGRREDSEEAEEVTGEEEKEEEEEEAK